jgi:hypothetical protein
MLNEKDFWKYKQDLLSKLGCWVVIIKNDTAQNNAKQNFGVHLVVFLKKKFVKSFFSL